MGLDIERRCPRGRRWTTGPGAGRYTDLTGKAHLPPRWSFGFWQSKISYQSAEEALEVVRKNRAHEIPTDVLHLDTFWFRENWRSDLEFDCLFSIFIRGL